jgi:TetR/AcrR family transcriptional regulator
MDNRDHILQVATRMFARRGFEGTSLQAIVEEVGIRKPTLLYYFSSKEILRQAVLDNLFDHWAQTLPRLLEAVTSGNDRFNMLTRELISFFREDPDRARLVMRELLDRPDEMRTQMANALRPWIILVADYVRKGQETGQLQRDVHPESYILHIVTMSIATMANMQVLSATLEPSSATKHFDPQETHLNELLRMARSSLFEHRQRG